MQLNLKSLILLICNSIHFSFPITKAVIQLRPYLAVTAHGSAAKIPEVYPGSITDTVLTEMVRALDNVLCHDGVLTDKGFAISEQATEKGAIHNRPPMKSAEQFTTGECNTNFKIACLRIHVERRRNNDSGEHKALMSIKDCPRLFKFACSTNA